MSDVRPPLTFKPFLVKESNAKFVQGERKTLATRHTGNLVLAVLFLVLCVGLTAFFTLELSKLNRLEASGATTTGSVSAHYKEVNTRTNETTGYLLDYTYSAVGTDGKRGFFTKDKQRVSEATYRKYLDRDPIPVRYLLDDPNTAFVVGEPLDTTSPLVGVGLFGLGILVSLLWILGVWRGMGRDRRLASEGQILQGELVKMTGRGGRGVIYLNINYAFKTPTGAQISGKQSETHRGRQYMVPPPGTPLAVLYVDEKLHKVL